MNESSIQLHPHLMTDYQQTARKQSNKLLEKQSDEPADQSDEDRGKELDIGELKAGDIALDDSQRKRKLSNKTSSAAMNLKESG